MLVTAKVPGCSSARPSQGSTMFVQPNLAATSGAQVDFPQPGGPTRMTMGKESDDMGKNSVVGRDFVTWYLPYCLERLDDGSYLPLNRAYKPVGTVTGNWVDYDAAPDMARLRLRAEEAEAIDHLGRPDVDGTVFLYDDTCIPSDSPEFWQAYSDRLAVLAGFTAGAEADHR